MIDWLDASQRLKDKADDANDSHDHDELHAASEIAYRLYVGDEFNEYVIRWVVGLL